MKENCNRIAVRFFFFPSSRTVIPNANNDEGAGDEDAQKNEVVDDMPWKTVVSRDRRKESSSGILLKCIS